MTAKISEVVRSWLGWCPNNRTNRRFSSAAYPVEEKSAGSSGREDGNPAINPFTRHGALIYALTNAACLLILVAVMKKILLVPADQLSQNFIIWIIIYAGMAVTYMGTTNGKKTIKSPIVTEVWCVVTISVTLAILGINMFW